jgi:hypothetical protein
MAQGKRRATCVEVRQSPPRLEVIRPQVIEPHDLKTFDVMDLIPKHRDTEGPHRFDQPPSHFRVRPARPVIVVAQNGKRGQASPGKMRIDVSHLLEHARMIAHEVAGHDDDIGAKLDDPAKRGQDVPVIHAPADVNIADLNQSAAGQRCGKTTDREGPASDLEPMGLDAPGIKSQSGGGDAASGSLKKPTAS